MIETGGRPWYWHTIQWLAVVLVFTVGPALGNLLFEMAESVIGRSPLLDVFLWWAVGYFRILAIAGGTIILLGTIRGVRAFIQSR